MKDNQYVVDDLNLKDSWRMFQIISEFVRGLKRCLKPIPAVSIFGSSQIEPESDVYKHTVTAAQPSGGRRV
jgi:hypothetical protein